MNKTKLWMEKLSTCLCYISRWYVMCTHGVYWFPLNTDVDIVYANVSFATMLF